MPRFRARNPSCRVVAIEPNESCTLMCGEVGRHLIEGIADGFIPGIFARHRHVIDEIVAVDSDTAIGEMRRLPASSGCSWARARARTWPPPASFGRGTRPCGTSSRSSATRGRSTSTTISSAPDQTAKRAAKAQHVGTWVIGRPWIIRVKWPATTWW